MSCVFVFACNSNHHLQPDLWIPWWCYWSFSMISSVLLVPIPPILANICADVHKIRNIMYNRDAKSICLLNGIDMPLPCYNQISLDLVDTFTSYLIRSPIKLLFKAPNIFLNWALTISSENQLVSNEGRLKLLWHSTTIIWAIHSLVLRVALLHSNNPCPNMTLLWLEPMTLILILILRSGFDHLIRKPFGV